MGKHGKPYDPANECVCDHDPRDKDWGHNPFCPADKTPYISGVSAYEEEMERIRHRYPLAEETDDRSE